MAVPMDSEPPSCSGTSTVRKDFDLSEDLCLLKAVVGFEHGNPFDYGSKAWCSIAKEVKERTTKICSATERTVRDRATKIVTKHRTDSSWRRRQSGVAEDYDEKEKLMDEAAVLYQNRVEKGKRKEDSKASAEKALAVKIREDAVASLSGKRRRDSLEEADIIVDMPLHEPAELGRAVEWPGETCTADDTKKRGPAKAKRVKKESNVQVLVGYFMGKDKVDDDLKQSELALQKERLSMEKERMEKDMEKHNDNVELEKLRLENEKKRLDTEAEERKRQSDLMMTLFQQLAENQGKK